jgi:hypothetical protein
MRNQTATMILVFACCFSGVAHATTDVICLGKVGKSSVNFGGSSGSDGAILFPPVGDPYLAINGKQIDLQDTERSYEGPWTTIRDPATKRLIFSFRKTNKKPVFHSRLKYELPRKYYQGAQFIYTDANGRFQIIDGACGEG